MNGLAHFNPTNMTMSSREIAELVEARHDNVKRTIETLGARGVITLPQIKEVSNSGPGPKTISVYKLDKRSSLIVVAQLCPEFTARIVDRWQQLEAQAAKPQLPNLMEALDDNGLLRNLLLNYTEKVAVLQHAVSDLAPKAEALERLSTAEGSLCLTDAAKALQLQPKKLLAKLQSLEWIHRRPMGSGWLAYQHRIQQGVLEHKVATGIKSDGSEWISTQVRVTAKGMARLAELLATHEPA